MTVQKTDAIRIPRSAVKYILFQRTPYLFIHRNRVAQSIMRLLPKWAAFFIESLFTTLNGTVTLEAALSRVPVERLFNEGLRKDLKTFEKYLPQNVKKILDIGCGVGGIDVVLSRYYESSQPDIYLLDKTEIPLRVYYGIRDRGCYYNSLEVTKNLLVINGIPEEKIFLQEATLNNSIDFNVEFDLIISLLSWGYHYPVSTYLDQVYEKLAPGGTLILDVRKGQGGIELLKSKFGNVAIVLKEEKSDRVIVKKR